ncbi:ZIP family metal transporter [Parvularcula flava]|uniref:ZIP family metal transporter n=1 Tax=Aquisalinus luteolus TaxID=1566827 RepID=A0ABX0HL21_9PROT|nr:ZIP family metal transporter [Aquisalinus luteolus]NHK28713.1 ZIP family metal transporter [Aquisalinus luteolus]
MVLAYLVEWNSPALIASLIAALVATLGLFCVWLNASFAEKYSGYFSAFAAGVLVMTALRLFPEGLAMTDKAPYWALGGYLSLYMINALLRHEPNAGIAVAPLLGIGLHSFLDGIEYGILYEHDIFIGLMASMGLILHEFAEGMILFAILRGSGMKPGLAVIVAFFGAALTTPVGAIISVEYLNDASPDILGILVSIASGALLYVGATHLTVHITNTNRFASVIVYVLGVIVAMGLSFAHHDLHDGADTGHENGIHSGVQDTEARQYPKDR